MTAHADSRPATSVASVDVTATSVTLPTEITLRGDRRVLVRPIREGDKAAVVTAFDRLSDDSRYTRFMASMHELPDDMLEAALHPAPGRELALVAVALTHEPDALIGGARYVAAPVAGTCEFAVTISDGWQGLGLASTLMRILIERARASGYLVMEGYVLSANTAMRRLARRLGFTDTVCPDDATLRIVTMDLTAAADR